MFNITATRKAVRSGSKRNQIIISLLFLLLGFLLGMIAKGLDVTPINKLPAFLESIDIVNLFGRVEIWALIALAIALFCKTPFRAAVNVLLFFAGMLISYCLFSVLWAGFMLDTAYLTIWLVLTAISPILAYIAWYARGRGLLGLVISSLLIAYFILAAFSFNGRFDYFDITYQGVEIFFLITIIVMLYVGIKQSLISIAVAMAVAYLVRLSGLSIPYIL